MVQQYGTHADALAMLLSMRGPEQFTAERNGGVARGAHGMVVSLYHLYSTIVSLLKGWYRLSET
jgi:hypothetical protein